MSHVAPAGQHSIDRAAILVTGSFGLIAATVFAGGPIPVVCAAVALLAALAAWHQSMLRWPSIVGVLLAIILFIPVGRYSIPLNLPFGMELYRLAVAVVLAIWAGALLVDSKVRLRRSPFDVAIVIVIAATFGSIALNLSRVVPLQAAVVKEVTFFLSFVFVYYFIVSVVRSRKTVESLLKFLVSGAAVVAMFAVFEQRTGFNIFDHATRVFPFMTFGGRVEADRYGLIRATASSAHPIELGVLLTLSVPLGIALGFGSARRWWIPTAIIAVGVMSTASRTPILVGVAASLVLIFLRPIEMRKLVPVLIPLLVVVKLAVPGSIATVKNAFFPPGGIVQEATTFSRGSDPLLAGGRVRQLGPSIKEAMRTPLLGQGWGTRQTGFNNPLRNAPILDNQWLGLLLELGILGVVGWALFIFRAGSALGRASRRRAGPDGWLATGLAASILGFGVGMFTFDAFAFTQVSFIFWVLLALSASLLLDRPDDASARISASGATS
jgi:O-Antigen ligase